MPKQHHIPIMDSGAIETFLDYYRFKNRIEFLKSGVQLGIRRFEWLSHYPMRLITTIERDTDRYYKSC